MTSPLIKIRRLRPLVARFTAIALAAAQLNVAEAACANYALPGANVSGGEFNAGSLPGRYGYDYIYPAQNEVDLLKSLNLKLMRVPILWERVQPVLSGALLESEMVRVDNVVQLALAGGLTVVLDVHNYSQYRGASLAASSAQPTALPDLWRRLAARYANRAGVDFGMMNEPHDMPADVWAGIAQRTLAAIRATGAQNLVMVPGTNWTGAQSWFSAVGPVSNATALLPLARGDANVVFEVHQYFDGDYSGTSDTCTAAQPALTALYNIGGWARTNHVKLFLGEFGTSQRSECLSTLNYATAILQNDRDVWYGWTYWAAGAWWGNYMFNLQSASGQAAQGAILKSRAATLNNAACTR